MKKAILTPALIVLAVCFVTFPVAAFEAPVITLERVEVANIQEFFAKPRVGYKSEAEPGKDIAAGAIMNTAYVFGIKNPAKEPVMLEEMTFSVAFDGIEVNTPMVYEQSWIPAGKTNQVRVIATNETLPTIGSLSVASEKAMKVKAMQTTAAALVKKWWDTIGDFAFPISVINGVATFKNEKGEQKKVSFSGEWPAKK
jgi:hypothetical protein